MKYNLIPEKEHNTQQPGIGVYAVTLTGITKTITHLGVYMSSDDAINHALDHVAINNPQLHQQVIQKKGYWDVQLLYIHHAKAVEQFNFLIELAPPTPFLVTQENVEEVIQNVKEAVAPKPANRQLTDEELQILEENRIKTEKNKKLAKLIDMGSLTALELEKDNLTKAEYLYIYDKIK